jgi:hypothetical protein
MAFARIASSAYQKWPFYISGLLCGVRDGTRCSSPFTVFSAWKRSSGSRNLNSARVCPGRRRPGAPSRWSEDAKAKLPLLNIYYMTQKDCSETRVVHRKNKPCWRFPDVSSSPAPPQWARTSRSTAPVRGPTHPSTPSSSHWREETCPKSESPLGHFIFFLTSPLGRSYTDLCGPILTCPDVCWRMLTYADVCCRMRDKDEVLKYKRPAGCIK